MTFSDYKQYWPVLLLLIVIVICSRLLLREAVAVADLRHSINSGMEFQTSPEKLASSILQIRQTKETMQTRLDSLRKNLTPFTNQGDVIKALTHEINQHKVRLVSLKPGKTVLQGDLDMLPIAIQASGSFEKICRLIWSLESKGSNYQIRSFTQQLNKKTTLTEIELELDVIIYRQEENEKPG